MADPLAALIWDSLLSLRGETLRLITEAGEDMLLSGIFTEQSQRSEPRKEGFRHSDIHSRSSNPCVSFFLKEESRKLKKTDRLIIRGRSFRIREILDEGMGFFKAALLKEKDVTAHADQKTL